MNSFQNSFNIVQLMTVYVNIISKLLTLTSKQPRTNIWIFLDELHDYHDCWIILIFNTK